MIQRYDANGFPLPDVPDYGALNQNFGREANYALRGPKSAVSDLEALANRNKTAALAAASADRTPASGKYVYDSATGQYIWVPAGTAAANTGLSTLPAYQDRGGGRGDMGPTGDGYSANVSPMSNPMSGGFAYDVVDAVSGIPGPLGFLAGLLGQQMNPQAVANAGKASAQAEKDAIEGYAKGTSTTGVNFGAPPSDPSTFGGAGYGTSVGKGGYGVTGMTGAGVAAKGGMGVDPAQAQGQGQIGDTAGMGRRGAGEASNSTPAASEASNAAIGAQAEAEGVALGPAATGDVGGGGGGGPGGCFLTTAAVSHMKQKDNGEVLNTLREFRDTYMRKNKEKSKDVAWYYKNAPRIVAALDKRSDADKVYKKMYSDFIKPAYNAIQEGDDAHAYEIYKDGIDFAKKHSGIDKEDLTPRYGPRGMASGGIADFAGGGLGDLGGYSDGGRLLRGPGDGVSDSIPASIGGKRPARLADGEFVVPARIVSELGNGSTDAGARKLYAMLDRIQAGRKKSIGKGKVATNSRSDKNLPA